MRILAHLACETVAVAATVAGSTINEQELDGGPHVGVVPLLACTVTGGHGSQSHGPGGFTVVLRTRCG
jgi:hypothetical protein